MADGTKSWRKIINVLKTDWRVIDLDKLTARKKAELRLIAQLTFEATLAAEEKLSKLVERTNAATRS